MTPSMRRALWMLYHAFITGKQHNENWRKLQKWQWMDCEAAKRDQEERLAKILRHAVSHVPYYASAFRETGVVDGKGQVRLENFSSIPLLDKSIIRERFADLTSDDIGQKPFTYNASGGSTGEPVRLIQDNAFGEWQYPCSLLSDEWTGYEFGQKKALLWGSERDLFFGRETLSVQLNRWLKNEIWLNSFRLPPERMKAFVDVLIKERPVQILAYVESIYELARFIEREGLPVCSPRSIITSAGTLYPHMREQIRRVFNAPVFNRYGSREVGTIACECDRHKGLHVFMPIHYLESVRSDGTPAQPGEVGELLVTTLTNYSMPLIRYRIGDMVSMAEERCSCGRGWPLLKKVTGRVSSTFVSSSGAYVHGEFFTHLMYFRDWISKFQVIQEDYQRIRLVIVPVQGGDLSFHFPAARGEIENKIKLAMGAGCSVEWDFVDDIPPLDSGKYCFTISKVGILPE